MADQILSLALRPKGLSSLVGQQSMVASLRLQMASRPPQTFLLTGSTGCGKTSLARIIALSLQCTHQKEWGDPCEACYAKEPNLDRGIWGYFSVHEINASSTRGVEELGKVAEIARFRPMAGLQRVIILDEAQRASTEAQNLLLKIFEHPPKTTTWIIATTEQSKILPTLRRRCFDLKLSGLGSKATEVLLQRAVKHTGCKIPLAPLISQLEQQGISSSALILMAMEKYISGFSAEDSVTGAETTTSTLGICKAVVNGKPKELRSLLYKVTPEESRWVRASVLGFIRASFWKENIPNVLSVQAYALQELSSGSAPVDDSLLISWLCGCLYKITKKFGSVRRA